MDEKKNPGLESLLDCGVVIIDKPPKLSSHEVTALVKKITGANRAGHAGTLDPDVTGVLPIALGRATKLLDYIVAKEKTYVGIMKFKKEQDTKSVLALFSKFTGDIIQTPPKISAVRKVPRKRTIRTLRFLEQEGKLVLFESEVQAGTYIRTLCEDMGKTCGGARMEELRRIAVGGITEGKCVAMQALADAVWLYKEKGDSSELEKIIRPVEEYLQDYPKIFAKGSAVSSLLNGAQLMAPGVSKCESFRKGERIAVYSEKGDFVGMGISLANSMEAGKMPSGPVVAMERVHMRRVQIAGK